MLNGIRKCQNSVLSKTNCLSSLFFLLVKNLSIFELNEWCILIDYIIVEILLLEIDVYMGKGAILVYTNI